MPATPVNPVRPPHLRPGDLIGLVAPASPALPTDRVQRGAAYLQQRGYQIRLGQFVHAQHGFCAGTDQERAADLNAMFRDPAVRAIFAIRGGYGSGRLLPLLDYPAIRRNPKILVGFSDITALQLGLARRCNLVTFSGPLPAVEFQRRPDPFTEAHFWHLLTSRRSPGRIPAPIDAPLRVLKTGAAEGPLVAGNLATLLSLVGTPWLPKLQGTILAIEEVGEHFHRLDRMLNQLRQTGLLSQLAGMIFGQFTHCTPARPDLPHPDLESLLHEAAEQVPGPVVANLAYGHLPCRVTLPFGTRLRINTRQKSLHLTEAAVS